MEDCILGDLVVCIGQNAVLTGREVKTLNGKVPYFRRKISPIFVYVDDFGISDDLVKKSDYYYRFPRRCSTYFEGFGCGGAFAEYLLTILELSDSCQSINIIYSADEGLGSGLAAFLVEYCANSMPGLIILTIGLLPHLGLGGLAGINTCLAMEKCMVYSSCCMLRRMDESDNLLSSKKSMARNKPRVSVYDEVCRCLAADILLAIREVHWVVSICTPGSKLVDVRSSMWHDALSLPTSSNARAKSRTGSKAAENTHHQSLRLLSMNMHSLHVSVPHDHTSTSESNSHQHLNSINIKFASIISITKESGNSRNFSDIDFQSSTAQESTLSMFHGATPTVGWKDAFHQSGERFSQHYMSPDSCIPIPSSRHGASNTMKSEMSSHMSAVCFTSPYAAVILRQSLSSALVATRAGAYSYWLNGENFHSSSSGADSFKDEGHSYNLQPSNQIDISLHQLECSIQHLLNACKSQSF